MQKISERIFGNTFNVFWIITKKSAASSPTKSIEKVLSSTFVDFCTKPFSTCNPIVWTCAQNCFQLSQAWKKWPQRYTACIRMYLSIWIREYSLDTFGAIFKHSIIDQITICILFKIIHFITQLRKWYNLFKRESKLCLL